MILFLKYLSILLILFGNLVIGQTRVLTGIDVLQKNNFVSLQGKRIGLITNQTGINRDGQRTIDILSKASGLKLVAIFAPEHGMNGTDDRETIDDTVDISKGIKIYSLYGETRRPSKEMLKGIDVLVYDIQDVGVRYYTYITTLAYCLEEASKQNKKFVVLDRPAMLRGDKVEGPVIRKELMSFVGYLQIVNRYGMTPGELAKMYNEEAKVGADLEVVPLEGWNRTMWFDGTGLPWRNPSPNIRSLAEALLYSGLGALEATNISVGRGTETPFEIIGAPYINGEQLAHELNMTFYIGARFQAIDFVPESMPFKGEKCHGVKIVITNRDALSPLELMVSIARMIQRESKEWNFKDKRTAQLVGTTSFAEKIAAGGCTCEINSGMRAESEKFKSDRKKYLLYK